MYSDIVKSLKTSEELEDLSSQVSDLKEAIYSTKSTTLEDALRKIVPFGIANKIRVSISSGISSQDFIEGLQKALSEVKVIKITLSLEPTEELIDMMQSFIENSTNIHKVLDIEIDPKIIGGLIIEDNGLYKDYSLRKIIVDYFSKSYEGRIQ